MSHRATPYDFGLGNQKLWWKEKMPTGSHSEFAFLHKPIVYGVARLLYGVATSDSVIKLSGATVIY